MSEKCVHNWYSRLAGLVSYEYFCLACGKKLTITGMEDHATELEARIAELEAESERFTAHSDIERKVDKSPNDTQTDTVVYGKESEE